MASATYNGLTSFSSFALIFLVFLALFFGVMPLYAAEVPCYLAENEAAARAVSCNRAACERQDMRQKLGAAIRYGG
jgi:hypothetical protein